MIARALSIVAAALASGAAASQLHAANWAYRSPLSHMPSLGHDVYSIAKRDAATLSYSGNVTFPWGIASGDAEPDSIILWTHPIAAEGSPSSICLRYQVSTSADKFDKKSIVDEGEAKTTPDVDYSLKVESKGLKANTQYYYRFTGCGKSIGKYTSPVGAFKTLPKAHDKKYNSAKLGVFSCSNYPEGYFVAYQTAADSDIDYWVHLGDYIYEKASNKPAAAGRIPQPTHEIVTLDDYRLRYKTYHNDTGLRALRAQKAGYPIPDDHEVADNTWKHGSADSNDTASGTIDGVNFTNRKKNAILAYHEWQPIRGHPSDSQFNIYRSFTFGTLFDLPLWDTRQSERDITDVYYNTAEIAKIKDQENRTLQGYSQEAWAFANVKNRKAQWSIIGQQIVMNQIIELQGGDPDLDLDAWDGYTAGECFLYR